MATADTTTQTFWTDLRFALDADSLEDAGFVVSELIELAEGQGLRFETTSVPPEGPLAR
jgi:hypothetical protein